MRMHPRVIVLVALASGVAAAAAGAAAWHLLRPRLPSPETADRDGLVRWLVTQDLSAEPVATRRVLARRLEEEFCSGVDWDATGKKLSPDQRRRLWHNLPALLDPWLEDKVDGYFGLSHQDRVAYVDRVIDTIHAWRGVSTLRPEAASEGPPDGQGPGLTAILYQRIAALEQGAGPERRNRMGQFLLAVQSRWFLRTVEGILPKKP